MDHHQHEGRAIREVIMNHPLYVSIHFWKVQLIRLLCGVCSNLESLGFLPTRKGRLKYKKKHIYMALC